MSEFEDMPTHLVALYDQAMASVNKQLNGIISLYHDVAKDAGHTEGAMLYCTQEIYKAVAEQEPSLDSPVLANFVGMTLRAVQLLEIEREKNNA